MVPRPFGDRQAIGGEATRNRPGTLLQSLGQHTRRHRLAGAAGGHLVEHRSAGKATHTAQHHAALAVLHGGQGVGGGQWLGGAGYGAKSLLDFGANAGCVKTARNDERGVVGAVMLAVKGIQRRQRNVFNIAAQAQHAVRVAVGSEGQGAHAVAQHTARFVFSPLKLVAHHRHFTVQISAGEFGLRHHSGEPVEHVVHALGGLLVVGEEVGEVVGAVKAGGAVPAHAQELHVAHRVVYLATGFKQHMLQQMRRARLAPALVARAHPVGDVHRGDGLGRVGHQQHLQAVGQGQLGDVLELLHLFELGFFGLAARLGQCQASEGDQASGQKPLNRGVHAASLHKNCPKNCVRWRDVQL